MIRRLKKEGVLDTVECGGVLLSAKNAVVNRKGASMTDLELNKKLALVIGWKLVTYIGNRCFVFDYEVGWKEFDHADWQVAGPIAQRFGLMVQFLHNKVFDPKSRIWRQADTPQRAIALIAIQGAGK